LPLVARVALAATLLSALAACAAPVQPTEPPFVPATSVPTVTPVSEPLDVILAWIECEDICEAPLQAVLQLGPEATPILIRIVTEGPPPARMEAMQAHLRRTFEELSAYAERHPEAALTIGEAEYVGLYLDNYAAQYLIRSAQALMAIGDPQAYGPIQEALQSAERPDVRDALQQALRILG
jgi:HEAT repeat protein